MSAHTPGPWTYVATGSGRRRSGGKAWLYAVVPSDQNRYGRVANVMDTESTCAEANARLIATAPELLATLEAICNRVIPAGEDSTGQKMVKLRLAMIEEARAVIRKATGEESEG